MVEVVTVVADVVVVWVLVVVVPLVEVISTHVLQRTGHMVLKSKSVKSSELHDAARFAEHTAGSGACRG